MKRRIMNRSLKKMDLDQKIAVILQMSSQEVQQITSAFLNEIMWTLVAGDEVYLPGFGIFHVSVRKGARKAHLTKGTFKKGERGSKHAVLVERKFYVNFRRAAAFKEKFDKHYGKNKTEDK